MSQQNYINVQQHNENAMDNENNQQIMIQDDKSQFSQDFQSDQQNPQQVQIQIDKQQQIKQKIYIPKVTNPISPYGVFMKTWRQTHPGQKMSMSSIGQIWKQLAAQQKQVYEKKFKEEKQKYEQYQALMLSIDPNYNKKNKSSSKNYFFPLHRIKAIMKMDNSYTTSTENISTMAKATQYFGLYLLQQIKKSGQGKKRIDFGDLFQAINNNQNNLWFLNCLIDEHNMQNVSTNKAPTHPENKKLRLDPIPTNSNNNNIANQQIADSQQIINRSKAKNKNENDRVPKTEKNNKTPKSKVKQLPKGQMKLTDMF